MTLKFVRLREISCADIIALHNDPRVRRHLPLADGYFDEDFCRQWVASKEQHWAQHGYGPWAFLVENAFAGWGGLQLEHGEADLALVLAPAYWGYGERIYREVIRQAFVELGLSSITALLPPSRTRVRGMARLGFQAAGEVQIAEERFIRYRLLKTL